MEDLTPEEWEELMSVEENHGRANINGARHRLDNTSLEEHFQYVVHVPIHGTRSSYNEGCRCKSCRRAERDYRRLLRSSSGSGTLLQDTNQKEE